MILLNCRYLYQYNLVSKETGFSLSKRSSSVIGVNGTYDLYDSRWSFCQKNELSTYNTLFLASSFNTNRMLSTTPNTEFYKSKFCRPTI